MTRAVVATQLVLAAAIAHADPVPGPGPVEAAPVTARPTLTRRGWAVDLSGYVQVDAVAWSQRSVDELGADGAPRNEERVLIRRGRLRAEAHRGRVRTAIEFDGNTTSGATARLLAANVSYAVSPYATLTAGLFRTPFGVEVPMAERTKPFLEPPTFARALVPGNYDAGAMVSGGYALVRWSAGVVNGAPVGDARWHGSDPSSSHDLVGRIGAVVPGPRKFWVEGGVSGLAGSGFHAGSPATKDDLQWTDDNGDGLVNASELTVVPGSPATPSAKYDRTALGGDLAVHWCFCRLGEGVAYVEAVVATNLDRGVIYADPVASSRDLRHAGFQLGVVQTVTKYARVGVRYDRYDADRDANEVEGVHLVGIDKTFTTLSLMASAHWHDARLLAEYDHERNPFGRGDDGTPTTRASDRLTLRAQVEF